MIAAIDTDALLELAWAAPLAVLTVTLAWGMVVHGAARAGDARRDGRRVAAGAHVLETGLGVALFLAALAFGLIIMTTK